MRPPKEGTKRYQKIVARGCGGHQTFCGPEPADYDCDHEYSWECDDCPCCIEAQKAEYKAERRQPLKTWTVWTEQVNACMFDVRARTKEEATEKAYRIWKRDHAETRVTDVVFLPNI